MAVPCETTIQSMIGNNANDSGIFYVTSIIADIHPKRQRVTFVCLVTTKV